MTNPFFNIILRLAAAGKSKQLFNASPNWFGEFHFSAYVTVIAVRSIKSTFNGNSNRQSHVPDRFTIFFFFIKWKEERRRRREGSFFCSPQIPIISRESFYNIEDSSKQRRISQKSIIRLIMDCHQFWLLKRTKMASSSRANSWKVNVLLFFFTCARFLMWQFQRFLTQEQLLWQILLAAVGYR